MRRPAKGRFASKRVPRLELRHEEESFSKYSEDTIRMTASVFPRDETSTTSQRNIKYAPLSAAANSSYDPTSERY